MIAFTVYGVAKPAGSKRAFAIRKNGVPTGRIAVSDANPNSRDWKNAVASAAREAYEGELLTGPLHVSLTFYRPRPMGHYKRAGGLSKAGLDTPYPISKPDVLKLARGVEDALSKVIYYDDSQIVHEVIKKNWGEPARVEVWIEPLQTVST